MLMTLGQVLARAVIDFYPADVTDPSAHYASCLVLPLLGRSLFLGKAFWRDRSEKKRRKRPKLHRRVKLDHVMNTWCGLALACLLAAVSVVAGMYGDSDFYDPATDRLLEELQKRLDEAKEGPDAFYQPDFGNFPWYSNEISAELRDDENMQEDIREPEHLSYGSQSQGFQYISGGAGEGKQELKPEGDLKNMQEVKSDEGLPFYCHPPNPCPKGYAAKDGCHDFIQDTVEEQQTWINKMMEKGMCTCDKEHMFSCPKEFADKPDSEDLNADPSQMDEILDYMNWEAKQQASDKHKWKNGEKLKVVAKKAPIVKRSVANEDAIEAELDRMKKRADWHHNPYLAGGKISTYAKKG